MGAEGAGEPVAMSSRPGVARMMRQVGARWRAWQLYISALAIFAASRLVVIVGIDFGPLLLPEPYTGKWSAGAAWFYRMVRWDGRWYGSIVTDGYQYSDAPGVLNSINFFPLYPLVSAAVKAVLRVDAFVAMLLVANVCSVIALLLLVRFVRDEAGEEAVLPTVSLFSFFPSSMFLSAAYTESICLVFVLLSLILMTQRKLLGSAAMAGVSLAARSTSIVLVPVLLYETWRNSSGRLIGSLPRLVACGVLASSGLIAYMAYLWFAFGHPLAFVASQQGFQSDPVSVKIWSALTLAALRRAEWPDALQFLVFVALIIGGFVRLRFSLALYGLGSIVVPYLLNGVTASTGRYLLLSVPAFMVLGSICRTRPWLTAALSGLLGALLLRKTALFSQWYWEG